MKVNCLKSPQIKKRKRKLLKGGNDQVKFSLANGVKQNGYVGKNPVYANISKPHELVNYQKVRSGVPFVKLSNHGIL
jgi:type III secretory pathway component EscU